MLVYILFQVLIAWLLLTKFKYRLELSFLFLFVFSAIRFDVGYDFLSYYTAIADYGGDTETFRRFGFFHGILIKLSSYLEFFQLYFILTSFFFYYFFYLVIRDFSDFPVVSLMVFIAIPFFFLMSFNFIRQFSALILVYYGFRYIFERRVVSYFLIVLLASSIHYTSIIALPLYYLYSRRFHWMVYVLVLISSFFAFPLAKYMVSVLIPGYSHYLDSPNKGGAVFQFFIFILSSLFLALGQYRGDVYRRFYFDVFILGVVLYNTFQPIGFAGTRVSYYYLFSLVLLVPKLFISVRPRQFLAIFFLLISILFSISLVLHSKVGTRSPSIPYSIFFGKTIEDIRPYDWVKE